MQEGSVTTFSLLILQPYRLRIYVLDTQGVALGCCSLSPLGLTITRQKPERLLIATAQGNALGIKHIDSQPEGLQD